jgi:elongation factor G
MPADKIRNVALVGHRGSGKTSLNEALLYEAGAVNRLGSVADGTSVSDSAPDEKARGMSIAALRVCESAVFVVNGVMGVEVNTERLWARAAELGLSRLIFVNMLDRERADFFRTLEQIKDSFGPHAVATEIPIGHEHEIRGVIDLIDM